MEDLKTQAVTKLRQVYKTTYANFPTTGIKEGDLAYATDRRVFYRWSGSAWEAVTIYSDSGTAAGIPTAADLPEGSLYYETDTSLLKQVQSGAWVTISGSPFTTQSVVTGSRALATNYQNTSGNTMMVTVTCNDNAGIPTVTVKTDSSSPPTTVVAMHTMHPTASEYMSVTFMVLNGNYYRVEMNRGGIGIWVEWY